MLPLSSIGTSLPLSAALHMDLRAKAILAQGRSVINFTVGEPDFFTPLSVKDAGIAAIRQNDTRYTNASGTARLKEAVAAAVCRDDGLTYPWDAVTITPGAKYAVFSALRTLLNPGDEVVLPAPYWTSYYHGILLCQGVPVVAPCLPEQGWKLRPEVLKSLLTPRTKALILNNPNNPTGAVYTPAELEALSHVIQQGDLYVISDEIYSRLVYTPRPFFPIAKLSPEIRERTVTIGGVSKSYAMTGWRIGFAIANPHITHGMRSFLSHTTGSPNTSAQAAAVEALTGPQDSVEKMRLEFRKRRDVVAGALSSVSGLRFSPPQGAFYLLLDVRAYLNESCPTDALLAEQILERAGVALVSGSDYGAEGYLRLSFTLPEEQLLEGADRLKAFFGHLA